MAKLESIEVDGYKSIRELHLELRDLNVLIGANGAGKSNLISAFGLLADLVAGRLRLHVGRRGGANSLLHFGSKQTTEVCLKVRFARGEYEYKVALSSTTDDGLLVEIESIGWPGGVFDLATFGGEAGIVRDIPLSAGIHASAVRDLIRGWRVHHFHDTSSSAPIKLKQDVDDNRELRADGSNLAAVLHALSHVAPAAYRRIVAATRQVAPYFDDFALDPDRLNPTKIMLGWRHRTDDSFFGPDALSDGTLRFIALATLLLQPNLPSLIVIDEPELGLHPFAIAQLAGMLRSAATRTQVIVATQSVTLLDQFTVDDVVVVDRNGESTFRRLDEAALAEWLEDYSLGDLWLKNLLGGRPG